MREDLLSWARGSTSSAGGITVSVYPRPATAIYILVLLICAVLLAYVDRQVLSLLITPIKQEFKLSDTRIAVLQGLALNLLFGLAIFPFAVLIDRGNRLRIVGGAIIGWSGFTALTGFSHSFPALVACRMGVGFCEAAVVPAAYSIIADLFATRHRANALLAFVGISMLAASASIALGSTAIADIEAHLTSIPGGFGPRSIWRLTFFLAAIPGFILAMLLLIPREPSRKDADNGRAPLVAFMRGRWRAVAYACGGLVLCNIGVDAVVMWMPTILERAYAIAPAASGKSLGLVLGAGSLGGVAMASFLTYAFRASHGRAAQLSVLKIGSVGAATVFPVLLLTHTVQGTFAVLILYFIFSFSAAGVGPGIVTGIAPNALRARVSAVWVTVNIMAGIAWPTAIGVLSDHVFHGARGLLASVWAVAAPCSSLAAIVIFVGHRQMRAALCPSH